MDFSDFASMLPTPSKAPLRQLTALWHSLLILSRQILYGVVRIKQKTTPVFSKTYIHFNFKRYDFSSVYFIVFCIYFMGH